MFVLLCFDKGDYVACHPLGAQQQRAMVTNVFLVDDQVIVIHLVKCNFVLVCADKSHLVFLVFDQIEKVWNAF